MKKKAVKKLKSLTAKINRENEKIERLYGSDSAGEDNPRYNKRKPAKKKRPKKQSSSRASTLAARIMSGEQKKITLANIKTLAASVLSQDEKQGQ